MTTHETTPPMPGALQANEEDSCRPTCAERQPLPTASSTCDTPTSSSTSSQASESSPPTGNPPKDGITPTDNSPPKHDTTPKGNTTSTDNTTPKESTTPKGDPSCCNVSGANILQIIILLTSIIIGSHIFGLVKPILDLLITTLVIPLLTTWWGVAMGIARAVLSAWDLGVKAAGWAVYGAVVSGFWYACHLLPLMVLRLVYEVAFGVKWGLEGDIAPSWGWEERLREKVKGVIRGEGVKDGEMRGVVGETAEGEWVQVEG